MPTDFPPQLTFISLEATPAVISHEQQLRILCRGQYPPNAAAETILDRDSTAIAAINDAVAAYSEEDAPPVSLAYQMAAWRALPRAADTLFAMARELLQTPTAAARASDLWSAPNETRKDPPLVATILHAVTNVLSQGKYIFLL